ncbi:helix-turn-helix transcriptional regulator [Ruminococcus sp.]|uniref:helix-turn-helix domain-containing protein n=1 Tax=Ruminococcus sp. TaxID=41978 RepID=UPI0025E708C9|nr:helix-turn-helix transcriptional regulator [Ruminococcus sp.]
MDSVTLGKRIKEARLAKKMTQSEVVGDFITRNMLSQIESGAAAPSIKTLEYLCRVLEIEPNALMPDENDCRSAYSADDYINIRKAFEQKNYKEVTQADIPENFKDETAALKAAAYCRLAEESSQSDDISQLQKAVDLAKKAEELSKTGIFANKAVADTAQQLLKANAQKLSDYYKSLLR